MIFSAPFSIVLSTVVKIRSKEQVPVTLTLAPTIGVLPVLTVRLRAGTWMLGNGGATGHRDRGDGGRSRCARFACRVLVVGGAGTGVDGVGGGEGEEFFGF